MPFAVVDSPVTVAGLIVVVVALLLVDLVFFARGREPTFRESVAWSVGWFVLGLAVALPIWAIDNGEGAVNYVTVYLIERTLSLDNLFVFLLIFGAFAVPQEHRGKLLFWGIALALVMRGLAILVGVELIERFHWVVYVLGATLLYLAWRILPGAHDDVDPRQGSTARGSSPARAAGASRRRWCSRSPAWSPPTSRSRSTRSPRRSRSPPTRSRSGRRTRSP